MAHQGQQRRNHFCLKDATKTAKHAAKQLSILESKITAKGEQTTSAKLPGLIKQFGENVTQLERAVKDIKQLQEEEHNFDFEETEVTKMFNRQKSFRHSKRKRSKKQDAHNHGQITGENDEDYDQRDLQHNDWRNERDSQYKRIKTEADCDKCKWREIDMNGLQDKLKATEKELEDANGRNNRQRAESMGRETQDLKRQVSDLRRRLQIEQKAKDETKAELDDALTRLSAVASSKLRDNNPNVVDLSDQNRPSKIAEQLSELYDNEWTNAYEVLEINKNDKECCTTLLEVLMDVYKKCKELATVGFYERIQQSIESPVPSAATSEPTKVQMSDYLKQQIKELRKYRAKFALEAIHKAVAPNVRVDMKETKEMKAYLKKCIDISWLMVVQDPPLAFNFGSSSYTFDTVAFRSYTKRGSHVEFVVWPAMLVHEGGSMLSKGIAQGYDDGKKPRLSSSTRI